MQRAVTLRADGGRQRMIVGLGVVADDLDLLFDEPLAGRRDEAGRVTQIVLAVLVLLVPAGVDDHDVARPHDLAGGLFEVVIGNWLPFLLRNRNHDAGAEKMRQRYLVDERRPLYDMRRRVDMCGVVHAGRDALRQHARLRHVVDAFDFDVFEIGPVRRLVPEAMGQIVERKSHRVVFVLLERNPANFLRHATLHVSSGLPPALVAFGPNATSETYVPGYGTSVSNSGGLDKPPGLAPQAAAASRCCSRASLVARSSATMRRWCL